MSLLKITPGRNNIKVYQGNNIDEILKFSTVTTSNNITVKTPINITAWSFEATATDGTNTYNATCSILDGANGTLRVLYSTAATANVTCMSHEIAATVASVRRTYAAGQITIISKNPECCDA